MEHVEVCAFVIHLPVNKLQIFCRPIHLSWPVDIAVQFHVLQLSFSFLQRLCWKFCICGLCWPVCERTSWTLYWDVRARMSCVMIFFENAVNFCMYSSQVWMHYDSIVLRIWCYDHLYLLYMKYGLLYDGVPCRSASRLRMLHAMRGCCLHRCSPAASW